MESCCHTPYQKLFDESLARKELRNYKRKGVKRTSRPLVNLVKNLPLNSSTLLDIGGGIGVISFELFKQGLKQSTQIDISKAFVETFLSEARNRQLADKVYAYTGDFLLYEEKIETADLVTLDKVICCYENFEELVQKSVAKARKWYVYTIPRDVWWVRIGHFLGEGVRRIMGSKFKSFVHPASVIENLVAGMGFSKFNTIYHREWMTVMFEK